MCSLQSLASKKLFVHFVLDPVIIPGSSDGASFAARYGCLVLIENVSYRYHWPDISMLYLSRVSVVCRLSGWKLELLFLLEGSVGSRS